LINIRKWAVETLGNPSGGYTRPDRQLQIGPNWPQFIQDGNRHCGVPVSMTGHVDNYVSHFLFWPIGAKFST
jgi:hypothetical protein